MLTDQRIIFSDKGVESDLSVTLNNFRAGTSTLAVVAAEDYLYIGSYLPFNHRYFMVSTVNDVTSAITVHNWFANSWVAVVDLLDETSVGGKTLATSGNISWRTNRLKGWDRELDSEDVTGITTTGIYDMYWIRISFSANLKATTALQYVGHKFSTDDILTSYYPDLANTSLMTSFETGKSTWDEQHFMAAQRIVMDLKTQNIIRSADQILDPSLFEEPACHKVAEIVYKGLGRSYNDDQTEARKYYLESLNKNFFNVDANANANLDDAERARTTGYITR